ncbi:MAG: homoserine dehydrogenase [Chloroflexi bacterium]|nr:homoserine dehydrogenase [Chloroflexota bacterium]
MTRAPLRVAVLGAGTVGREVVRELLASRFAELQLVGVAVRDIGKAQADGIPEALLTDAPAHLVAGDSDVIVELMGGEEPARTLIGAALGAGKPVVTANKLVLARHGAELERVARERDSPLRFEASVMGGTPVLRLLAEDLAGTRLTALRGIVNGTTNHILTEMAASGMSYADALDAAQAAGYAEADPAADVEGGDAADKLVILARMAFGAWLDRAAVPRAEPGRAAGITGVTAEDLRAAAAGGEAIRLIASTERAPDGAIVAAVLPSKVPLESAFGRTLGVRNRLEIEADPLGTVAVEGPGAGGAATANAVLSDLVAIARGKGSTWGALPPASTADQRAPWDAE